MLESQIVLEEEFEITQIHNLLELQRNFEPNWKQNGSLPTLSNSDISDMTI